MSLVAFALLNREKLDQPQQKVPDEFTSVYISSKKEDNDYEHSQIAINSAAKTNNKASLARSFVSFFIKSKADKQMLESELEEIVKEKVLNPSGVTIQRTKHIKDLKQLIEDSREYIVKREDYFRHEAPQPGSSCPQSMIANNNGSPAKIGIGSLSGTY